MLKNCFGPYPDEPLLYIFDKLLGLFHKFDFKLKCTVGEKQIGTTPTASADDKINEVINRTTTESDASGAATTCANDITVAHDMADVTVMKKVSVEIVETASHISKRNGVERLTEVSPDELPQKLKNILASKSILKTTSSMECNYPLSKVDIRKKSLHTDLVPKRALRFAKSSKKKYTQKKGFGDSVTASVRVVQEKFEKKIFLSDDKNSFESILRKEIKQQKIQASPNMNISRLERSGNQTFKEFTTRPQKDSRNRKLRDRKVTKTEWAVTRIYTFDDDSQTYEVMNKDKVHRNDAVKRIFAIAPNLTTIAYDPLKREDKMR
ncbi:hypothetical protein Bhyg_12373 [Pseudolycoriella hygida]|uniref:Uncharacterized protein n=1 Tax=Pseudolycoriella hygida TaxID=35572 RepID=A0A9Q0MX35_9DIPT|nr:hypothetical protein Bhyg_12373 [Pseudolycoriella hygida]